jgi:hypothetical protein
MGIRHGFTSTVGDGSDNTLLHPTNWNSEHLVDAFAPTGLTGAVAPARFVGGTTSGAPVTGTFAVGDYVIAQNAKIWVCTVAGSPGTWVAVGEEADIVQVASGAGSAVVPGLKVADRLPASHSAYDDEFDGDLSAWTTLGSLDVLNTSDIPSHVHMGVTNGSAINGIYKTAPPTPFTVTAKITDKMFSANLHSAGLMLLDASPGRLFNFYQNYNTGYGNLQGGDVDQWSNRTTRGSYTDINFRQCQYLRLIVASTGVVTAQASYTGLVWVTLSSNYFSGVSPVNVGLMIWKYYSTSMEACFDWIRFSGMGSYGAAIPAMTSATAPSGTVSASSYYSTTPAWHAFETSISDGDGGHGWITNGTSTGWIRYQFPTAKTAVAYSIRPWWYDNYPGRTPKTWTFEGSNNGSAWTTLDTQTNWASANSTDNAYFTVSSPGSYLYYQLNVSANNGNGYMGVGNFQVYTAR